MGRKLRGVTRTIRRRSGEAKAEVLKLTEQTGELLERSIKEARGSPLVARRSARGRGAQRSSRAASRLEELADRCESRGQIRQRRRGGADQRSDRVAFAIRTPGRSARGSSASRTSSGTSRRSRR